MQDESKKDLGLERVKKWLYAKGLDERSSGCVLCGSCYGHGPANSMEDVPGPKTKCPPYEFYRFQRHTPESRWLMAQRVFHGLDPITRELKEIIYSCTTCLMCQELCGVRSDGFGPWGITVVEMKRNQRWAWCCGGGGGVPEADPDLARWSATDRLREAKESDAELVLTSSALCQRSFTALEQPALPSQDLFEFIGQAV